MKGKSIILLSWGLAFFFLLVSKGQALYIYEDFDTSASNWTFNGDAYWQAWQPYAVLTPEYGYQAGSMWYNQAFDLSNYSSFTAEFDIYLGIKDDSGGEGITFAVIDASDGLNTLGAGGGGLGYAGIAGHSIAVEFDTNYNYGNNDPLPTFFTDEDHIGIDLNGGIASAIPVKTGNIENSSWHHVIVNFDITTGTISVSLDGTTYINNYHIGLFTPFTAYFGFTGATSSYCNLQRVDNFKLTLAPVPIPGSALLVASGLLSLLGIRGIRRKSFK